MAAAGGWAYVRSQYYVGVANDRIAIYRGVEGSVAGIHLAKVEQSYDTPVAALPQPEQQQVRDGLIVANLREARDKVAFLQARVPRPSPSATPTPRPTPSLPRS